MNQYQSLQISSAPNVNPVEWGEGQLDSLEPGIVRWILDRYRSVFEISLLLTSAYSNGVGNLDIRCVLVFTTMKSIITLHGSGTDANSIGSMQSLSGILVGRNLLKIRRIPS